VSFAGASRRDINLLWHGRLKAVEVIAFLVAPIALTVGWATVIA